jgi:hypothetical protein
MKTRTLGCLTLGIALLNGCATATSPLTDKASNPITGTQVATLAGGTALGAVAGDAVGGRKGAIIGGVAGLATSALVYNAVANHDAEIATEAEARGERKGRVEVFQQMWDSTTRSPGRAGSSETATNADIVAYPAQTIEGVKFAPRQDAGEPLTEPTR